MSKALKVLLELKESASYWSEYDVPIGIHERIEEAIQELTAKPEKKIIDLNMVDKHLEICDLSEDYKDGYSDGIVYAEREHGVRGLYE